MTTDPILGDGYSTRRLELGSDTEGPVIATLIHREAGADGAPQGRGQRGAPVGDEPIGQPITKPPILVMHGWSDYVFDRDLLDHLGALGHDVWALDLRKHGRSLLPGQTPTSIDHLSRYDREIDQSLRIIGRSRPPILLAHSAGGLIAALWAQRRPGTVRGLALNSPWLEMHLGPGARTLADGPVRILADALHHRPILPPGSTHYARSTHRDYGGRYDYDLALKPERGHRFPADTFAAVIDGQKRLRAAGPLAIPVLVLHSARTRIGVKFTEAMRRADSVLDIRTLANAAYRLGAQVQVEAIEGARHDVFLSDADARARSICALDTWLDTIDV